MENSQQILKLAYKSGCRGSKNEKGPTTRYRYSRIACIAFFCFYDLVHPVKTLTKITNMELNIIQYKIYQVRGVRVMLDFDLAELYQVETKVLKQTVRRNLDRFPEDFMFELTEQEHNSLIISLRSQFVTSNNKGGRRYMPFAFTEHGVIMLASLLRSDTAIQTSIKITRAFVAMRNYLMSTQHLESELTALKAKLELLERNDEENLEAINDLSEDVRHEIDNIYMAIAALSVKPADESDKAVKKIGFK